ncbi:MAG TPA: hypothetical protein DCQ37_10305 [Desulfobacteraceae bacterium]|nr:hypothetical protein [Desulfobacteraceae bacterium]
MVSIELSPIVEKNFLEVVHSTYNGDIQQAITALLNLHKKYGWKEQLRADVDSVRTEVRKRGGIRAESVDNAIEKYRSNIRRSDG